MTLRASALLVSAALLPLLAGCGRATVIDHYPAFYDPQLKTIAIVEFYNTTYQPAAGAHVANRLAEALRANGTYRVIGPRELADRLSAEELKAVQGSNPQAAAERMRKVEGVQAFITGTVTVFNPGQTRVVWTDYDYDHYYYRGRWRYGPSYSSYYVECSDARVAVEAVLVRLSDGAVIHDTDGPLYAEANWRGAPPRVPADACLSLAMNHMMRLLLSEFAVTPMRITIKPGDLRTAHPTAGGDWKVTDDFRPADAEMLVLLRLPPEADRNDFRLTITRKGQARHELAPTRPRPAATAPATAAATAPAQRLRPSNVLVEQEFTWSGSDKVRSFSFSPERIARAAGAGKYEVNLYRGGQLVISRGFRIEQ